jgi:hypothetical protein
MGKKLRIALLQFAGNAILLWLGYYWLGTGESRASALAWSAFLALALVALASWLQGATFAHFRALRMPLRNLPLLVLAAIFVLVLYFLLARWQDSTSNLALRTASWLTLKLRKPVKPVAVMRVFGVFFWIIRWMAIPVFALPLVADLAVFGAKGARGFGRLARKLRYWAETPILLVCAFWLPLRLVGWVPHVNGFAFEMASFVLRLALAYLLFTAAWLLLAWRSSYGD